MFSAKKVFDIGVISNIIFYMKSQTNRKIGTENHGSLKKTAGLPADKSGSSAFFIYNDKKTRSTLQQLYSRSLP
jgi:chemotaxis methyl-accepting protein methylase